MIKKLLLNPLLYTGFCLLVAFTLFIRYELTASPSCEFDLTTPYVMTLFVFAVLCVVTAINFNAQLSRYAVILAFWVLAGVVWSVFDPLLAC